MSLDVLWNKCLDIIKEDISSLAFETWFKDTSLHKVTDNKITIIVTMQIHKNHLLTNYNELLQKAISKVFNNELEIEFLTNDEIEENNFEDMILDEESSDENFESNLNPNYTFESFIVGNSNKFAQAAALSVAENPGKMYNPLFIYGNSGLGKTHLMHAIGNYIQKNSKKRVLYVTSEQFISDFVNINRKDSNNNNLGYIELFKNKYRNIDVLMIDDIQFLGGASETQKEFFHTFNNLYSDNKQIIINSDRSPDDLKILEDRLRTRFAWGLTVDIFPPDFELKKEILKNKLIGQNIETEIPEDVIEYMASNIGNDVRNLEGAITRLLAYSTIMGGSKIDLNLATEALREYVKKGYRDTNDIKKIQKIVAEYFKISVEEMISSKRSTNLTFPRQIAMYLSRKLTDESFPRIGIEFGGKNHATVMHACNKIESKIRTDRSISNIVDNIIKEIS